MTRRRQSVVLITVALAALALGTGAVIIVRHGSSVAPHSIPPPATVVPLASGSVGIVLDGGSTRTSDADVAVAINAPPDATEMQVSVDPSFSGAVWTALATSTTVRLDDGGYQMVFARTRPASGTPVGEVLVAGIDFDRTWDAATSSADGRLHRTSFIGLVAPDVLQVRIETGRVLWNADAPNDRLVGRPIDTAPLDDAARYRVDGTPIMSVSRVSRPFGMATIDGVQQPAMVHDLYVRLVAPLTTGRNHTLAIDGADVASSTFAIDPATSPSPAVHVNQVGFGPADQGKVGFVSAWTGAAGGVRLTETMPFSVLDLATGSVALTGATTRRPIGARNEWGMGDLTGADVVAADFSAVTTPGRYRLCVQPLGCSEPFVISATEAWQRSAVDVARAMYHQRSGVALTPPFTAIDRPRPFHPNDGVLFHQTTVTALDHLDNVGGDDRFAEYPAADTGTTVANAWGGHFDAGDWNSRIGHLDYLRVALDLARLYPATYDSLRLDIPESGNEIPDIVDEGLWDLDLYRRLQHADGGVPGGVDQSRFGEGEETSWHNTVKVYVFAPDVWSTYIYAGVAAQTAVLLNSYDSALAATYDASARKAMAWAESQWAAINRTRQLTDVIDPERATAAASMLALTGDDRWNDVFASSSTFDDGPMALLDGAGPVARSAWTYAELPAALARPPIAANAKASIVNNADAQLASQATAAFGWVMERPQQPIVWGLGPSMPHGINLLRAFVLTGDVRYRTAMVQAASFTLGANPLNTSFVTSLGANPARYPLQVDAKHVGIPVTPGLPVYGIHDLGVSTADDWVVTSFLGPEGTTPSADSVPVLWSFYDTSAFPMMNEFTVSQSLTTALWTFGVLAAS